MLSTVEASESNTISTGASAGYVGPLERLAKVSGNSCYQLIVIAGSGKMKLHMVFMPQAL